MPSNKNRLYLDLESAILGTSAPAEIIDELELVPVDYVDFDKRYAVGQLVVAKSCASAVQNIFGAIRDADFSLYSVIPIALFQHDDHASIAQNNSSAFNYRAVVGTDPPRLSKHSYGTAVDINPRVNPYVHADGTPIMGSYPYEPYDPAIPGTIVEGDAVVRAFDDYGWEWGGRWTDGTLDYQHFSLT